MEELTKKIAGLSFRNFDNDYDALVTVRNQSKEHDKVDDLSVLERTPTVQELRETIAYDHCDPIQDVMIAEINGNVIGYARVAWWTETDGTWLFLHNEYVIPSWRKQGIEDVLFAWAEKHIQNLAKELHATGKLQYGTNATDTEKENTELILQHGYKSVFSTVEMEFIDFSNLREAALPEGFHLKDVSSEDARQIWEVNNEIYADRDFVREPTEEDFQEFSNNPLNDYSLWAVAYHENEIAGFVLSQIEKGRGEIAEVSIRKKFRRRGLAYALLVENLLRLKKKGITLARLHTDGGNVAGAKSLYENVGFTVIKTFVRYRKEFSL